MKVVLKNFPLSFHKQAEQAAIYVLAANRQGRDSYLKLHHKVMDNFRDLKTNPDLPLDLAKELGLDVEKLKLDAQDPSIKAQIAIETNEMKKRWWTNWSDHEEFSTLLFVEGDRVRNLLGESRIFWH